jgi:tetratricopeptide (TPR) repeat protein
VLSGQCKPRSAEVPQARACSILEQEHGAPHPQLALCLGNLAALLAQRGEHEESLAMKRRALAMFEVLPGHPNHVTMTRRNVVRSLLELGRTDEAARELEAAAAGSSSESDETAILGLRGDLARRRGDLHAATSAHAGVVERTGKLEASRRIEPRLSLAISELEGKRFTDAATHAELALADARAAYGDTSCRTAEPSRVLADALIDSGRGPAALVHAEHALATFDAVEPDPLATARAKLAVARALGDAERARALRLAREAREVAEKAGRDPSLVARADAWLAKNP